MGDNLENDPKKGIESIYLSKNSIILNQIKCLKVDSTTVFPRIVSALE